MLETACSRVGHIYRHRKKDVNSHIGFDYFHKVRVFFSVRLFQSFRQSNGSPSLR